MVSYLGDYPVAGVSLANKFFELFVTIAFAVMGLIIYWLQGNMLRVILMILKILFLLVS